jgi:hypothetical protein
VRLTEEADLSARLLELKEEGKEVSGRRVAVPLDCTAQGFQSFQRDTPRRLSFEVASKTLPALDLSTILKLASKTHR